MRPHRHPEQRTCPCGTHLSVYNPAPICAQCSRHDPHVRRNNRPARCGTDSGYFRHLRTTLTEPCDACRQAHADAENARTARRRP